jgi:hypothetical protein
VKEAFDQPCFSADPFHCVAQLMRQVRDVEAGYIAQFHPFELLPKTLARVQLWGIGGQALQMQALRRASG